MQLDRSVVSNFMYVGSLGLLMLAQKLELDVVFFATLFRWLNLTSVELFRNTLLASGLTTGVLLLLESLRLAEEVVIRWNDE